MRIRAIAFTLCAALLFSICGCKDNNSSSLSNLDTDSVKTLYTDAAKAITSTDTLTIQIDGVKETKTSNQTFTETTQQTVKFSGRNTQTPRVSMDGRITIGTSQIAYSEQFDNGKAYITVNGSKFTAAATSEEYIARFCTAVLLDMMLYGQAKAESADSGTVLNFTEPTGAEGWALPDGAQFTEASASAILDADNALVANAYTITYRLGTAKITETTTVTIVSITEASVSEPGETSGYTPLSYLDAPLQLERASAYLIQSTKIQATTTQNIVCEAFAINRDQTTSLSLSGRGDDFRAQLDINVHQINQSKGGEVTQIQQTELFDNGTYTISTNGSEPTPNPNVDQAAMLSYCQNNLVSTILLPEHITGAELAETDTAYRITFTASHALAEAICSDVCNTLYGDPNLLDTLASSYSTEAVECYLELDKLTGLPITSGLQHRTTHTIEEISYLITSQTVQSYTYE